MTGPPPIPFNKPALAGRESEYLLDAVDRMHISGDGYYTGRCHELLEEMLQAQRVLLTTSCTTALEMAALLLEIEPGDEVIMPSFTFVSTANAFALRGARIVFADIDPHTLNIDPDHVRSLVTERTRAIVPVHYAGVACDMDAIMAIARDHGVPVIEDAAQALGASYRNVPLGTIGSIGTLSFHETKNAICGEGGAIILNDETLVSRARDHSGKGDQPDILLQRRSRQVHMVRPGEFDAAIGSAGGIPLRPVGKHRAVECSAHDAVESLPVCL